MKDPVESLGQEAYLALERMVRELLARKPGAHLVESQLDLLDLHLPLVLKGADADPRVFAKRLASSIDQILDDALQHAAAFRPGHAYCHRCENAVCEHSKPPSGRHVFVGYAQTGTPRWIDLAQLCLERKHPLVDRLYDERPAFVTLVFERPELHGGMLRAFRDGSYELWGQVVAGFFPLRSRAEEGRGVLALTVQAAASRSRTGHHRFGLNLLGRAPSGEDLDSLWERHRELPWRKAVQWAQSALQTMPRTRSTAGSGTRGGELDQRISRIMLGLARRLERDQRARSRRTQHAEERHASGRRPTRKAIDDAREATLESCMIDVRSETLVVLGERGRTHFFTLSGQHVSSVRYSKDAIARKLKREQWRRANSDELQTFQNRLA